MLQSGRAAAERVFDILDSVDEPGLDDGVKLKVPVNGKVEYRDVEFNYAEGIQTINGFMMFVKMPKEMIKNTLLMSPDFQKLRFLYQMLISDVGPLVSMHRKRFIDMVFVRY